MFVKKQRFKTVSHVFNKIYENILQISEPKYLALPSPFENNFCYYIVISFIQSNYHFPHFFPNTTCILKGTYWSNLVKYLSGGNYTFYYNLISISCHNNEIHS